MAVIRTLHIGGITMQVGDYWWRVYKYKDDREVEDEVDATDAFVDGNGSLVLINDGDTQVIYAAGVWKEVRRVTVKESDNE